MLVDEFQDLNPLQYSVIRELGREHRHVFAVGDDEQSIYSWAGADRTVFLTFPNDFGIAQRITLRENRRCPREIFALARRLIEHNPTLFDEPKLLEAERDVAVPRRRAHASPTTTPSASGWWTTSSATATSTGIAWGDVALLYRTHEIGDRARGGVPHRGIPCRLAHGRALVEDPIIAYVLAALQVIAQPGRRARRRVPRRRRFRAGCVDDARARCAAHGEHAARAAGGDGARARARARRRRARIRRACYALDNLPALARQHASADGARGGAALAARRHVRTVLEEHHDELSDPADHAEVVSLARSTARRARDARRTIWIERRRGVEIPLAGLLRRAGSTHVRLGALPPTDAEPILADDAPVLGLPLALFKALQLLAMRRRELGVPRLHRRRHRDDRRDVAERAEIVEIAAVRVRDGAIVDEFSALVRPRRSDRSGGGARARHLRAPTSPTRRLRGRVAARPRVLRQRRARRAQRLPLRLPDPRADGGAGETARVHVRHAPAGARAVHEQPRASGTSPSGSASTAGRSHRALDDSRTLAKVFLALRALNDAFARKTALAHLLDYVAVALVLWPEDAARRGAMLRDRAGTSPSAATATRSTSTTPSVGARRRRAVPPDGATTSSSGSAARS